MAKVNFFNLAKSFVRKLHFPMIMHIWKLDDEDTSFRE